MRESLLVRYLQASARADWECKQVDVDGETCVSQGAKLHKPFALTTDEGRSSSLTYRKALHGSGGIEMSVNGGTADAKRVLELIQQGGGFVLESSSLEDDLQRDGKQTEGAKLIAWRRTQRPMRESQSQPAVDDSHRSTLAQRQRAVKAGNGSCRSRQRQHTVHGDDERDLSDTPMMRRSDHSRERAGGEWNWGGHRSGR